MASVNFRGKCKGAGEAKAVMRHSEPEERLAREHSNTEINKERTKLNRSCFGLSYKKACEKYDERIQDLDATTNKNKRKDRVTMFDLYVPTPKELPEENENKWFSKVLSLIAKQYGKENIIDAHIHRDEIHEYTDARTGEKATSRTHMHAWLIPEINGGLNGKLFSSNANMMRLNNSIQEMTERDFGVEFMDGSGKKSKGTVEELKNESRKLAQQEMTTGIIKEREEELNAYEQELLEREQKLDEREKYVSGDEVKFRKSKFGKREEDLNRRERSLASQQESVQNEVAEATAMMAAAQKQKKELEEMLQEAQRKIDQAREEFEVWIEQSKTSVQKMKKTPREKMILAIIEQGYPEIHEKATKRYEAYLKKKNNALIEEAHAEYRSARDRLNQSDDLQLGG